MSVRRPTVSVVVPCYRYGHFLPECVGSILDQEGVDVRVLVIDDASPDDSAQAARRLAAADARVEVRVHEVNRGHIATYNEGLLDWADGDYSVLISADDVLAPGALARATAVLEEHPEIGFVYGHSGYWTRHRAAPARADGADRAHGLDRARVAADHVQARSHGRVLARGGRADAAPAADRRLPAVAAAHRRRRDVDALRGPFRRRLHQGRRPGLLPAPRRADDDGARADRRPAPAQGRLRRPLRCVRRPHPRAPTGCNGGRTARWPRRPCGARAGPTTAAGWTRRR